MTEEDDLEDLPQLQAEMVEEENPYERESYSYVSPREGKDVSVDGTFRVRDETAARMHAITERHHARLERTGWTIKRMLSHIEGYMEAHRDAAGTHRLGELQRISHDLQRADNAVEQIARTMDEWRDMRGEYHFEPGKMVTPLSDAQKEVMEKNVARPLRQGARALQNLRNLHDALVEEGLEPVYKDDPTMDTLHIVTSSKEKVLLRDAIRTLHEVAEDVGKDSDLRKVVGMYGPKTENWRDTVEWEKAKAPAEPAK